MVDIRQATKGCWLYYRLSRNGHHSNHTRVFLALSNSEWTWRYQWILYEMYRLTCVDDWNWIYQIERSRGTWDRGLTRTGLWPDPRSGRCYHIKLIRVGFYRATRQSRRPNHYAPRGFEDISSNLYQPIARSKPNAVSLFDKLFSWGLIWG